MAAYTLGYGGLKPELFLELLQKLGCRIVVDVRRFPHSKISFYTGDVLKLELERIGVSYVWLGELGALGMGGRYKPAEPATCTDSSTFRAYVAYLVSEPQPLNALLKIREMAAEGLNPLIICRERKPAHCHRQYVADALVAMGVEVLHIVGGELMRHAGSTCYNYIREKLAA